MITQKLLDQVVAWDHTVTVNAYTANDVFTLHFERKWFRRQQIRLRIPRDITNKDTIEGTFTHSSSHRGKWLSRMLCNHTDATFMVEEEEQTPVKAPVLTLVPTDDDK